MTSKNKNSKARQHRRNLWSRGKWWFITGGAAAAITLLLALSTSLPAPETSESDITAADVRLATLDGEFQLSDLQGKPLLLYFSFPG